MSTWWSGLKDQKVLCYLFYTLRSAQKYKVYCVLGIKIQLPVKIQLTIMLITGGYGPMLCTQVCGQTKMGMISHGFTRALIYCYLVAVGAGLTCSAWQVNNHLINDL